MEKMTGIKAAIAAFFTGLSAILGWQGVLALVWLACMILDYISGSIAAAKNGEWNSKTAREGIFHKGGMLLIVLLALLLDLAMRVACENMALGFVWPGLVTPLVLVWYVITEMGSILENAIKLGANVPAWLTKLLKASLKAAEKTGEAVVPAVDDKTDTETNATDEDE